jgi:methionyl-tRNA synthetase
MLQKFNQGIAPVGGYASQPDDDEWRGRAEDLVIAWRQAFDSVNPKGALTLVWEYVSLLNKTIDSEAPWVLAKDPAKRDRLLAVLSRLAEGLALVSALFWPVMPKTAENMWQRLGLDPGAITTESKTIRSLLAHRKPLAAGEAFFPRIETEESKAVKSTKAEKALADKTTVKTDSAKVEPRTDGLITIDDFKKAELRVAKIEATERVPKSDKLIKLSLSLGETQRTVLAGIGKSYSPEELVGRLVVIVANLVPAKLMGQESQGMVLAASNEGQLLLVTVAGEIAPGAKIS